MYIHNFEPTRWPSGSPDSSVQLLDTVWGNRFVAYENLYDG